MRCTRGPKRRPVGGSPVRDGIRPQTRFAEAGAGFSSPAPDLKEFISPQWMVGRKKSKRSRSSLDTRYLPTKFDRNRTGYEFRHFRTYIGMEKKSKFVPRPISMKFGGQVPVINRGTGQFRFFPSDHLLWRNNFFKSGAEPGAGFADWLWSSNPASGKFFRASPTRKRPSQTSYHSEKPKFIKIGQVADEQHPIALPAPDFGNPAPECRNAPRTGGVRGNHDSARTERGTYINLVLAQS